MSKNSVKQEHKNNALGVRIAPKRLFGDVLMLNNAKRSAGLNTGLLKATISGNYVNTRVTALLNLNASKTIGLADCLMNIQTTHGIGT